MKRIVLATGLVALASNSARSVLPASSIAAFEFSPAAKCVEMAFP